MAAVPFFEEAAGFFCLAECGEQVDPGSDFYDMYRPLEEYTDYT